MALNRLIASPARVLTSVALATLVLVGGGQVGLAGSRGPEPSGVRTTQAPDKKSRPKRLQIRVAPAQGGAPRNARANQDAGVEPQNEPAVAVDPLNGQRIVIGANDYRGDDVEARSYWSHDGGQTWNDSAPVTDPGRDFRGGEARGDPSLGWDRNGNVFFGFIAFDRDVNDQGGIYVAKSTDGGQTYASVAEVIANTLSEGHDKSYLTADATTGPFSGRVYISWTRFSGINADILFARSTDGGLTFTTLANPINVCRFNQGSIPVVGPGGEVYVFWEEFAGRSGCSDRIVGVKSTDGGVTFGSPFEVSDIVEVPEPLDNSEFRTATFPAAAVSPADGTVYVVWNDNRKGNADIMLSRSTDGGMKWTSPRRVNDNAKNDQFFPWVAVMPDGKVVVNWWDRRDDPDNTVFHHYLAVSTDGAKRFGRARRVSTVPSSGAVDFDGEFIGDYGGVAVSATYIFPVWVDTRNGNQDIFTARVSPDPSVPGPGGTPNAPTGLAAAPSGPRQVTLAWTDASDNERGFRVERRENKPNKRFSKIEELGPGTTGHVDQRGLKAGREYCYRVLATNEQGSSPPSNEFCVTPI